MSPPQPIPSLEETYDYDKYLLPLKPTATPLSIVEVGKNEADDAELNELISQYLINDDPTEENPDASEESNNKEANGTAGGDSKSPKKESQDDVIEENIISDDGDDVKKDETNDPEKESSSSSSDSTSEHDEKTEEESSSSSESEEESEEDEYEVEAIVGHAWKGGTKRYVVKWKGYSSRHNTIEPLENLSNCKSLIDAYERSLTPKRSSAVAATQKIAPKKPRITRQSPRVERVERRNMKEESSSGEDEYSSEDDRKNKVRQEERKEDLQKQALQLIKAKRAAKGKSPTFPPANLAKESKVQSEEPAKITKTTSLLGLFPNLSKNAIPLGTKGAKKIKSIFPPLNGNSVSGSGGNESRNLPKKEVEDTSSSPLPLYIQEENGGYQQEVDDDYEREVEEAKPMDCEIETQMAEEVFDPFEDARKLKAYLEGMEAFQAKLAELSGAPVMVVNDVDLCTPPCDFSFVEIYKGVHFEKVTNDSKEGCACGNGVCISSICKCSLKHGQKKHRESDCKPLYECNANCPCGPFCPNRRIQREGRTVPVQIFRTNRKGWGLRALRDVQRDEFVDRYVGEVLTPKQADERPDTSYQFDLDYCYGPDEQGDYVVDSKFIGAPCRFMNHSCEPNCYVRPMFIWGRNETLPEIGFFAKRDIRAGEELTFDYFCGQKTNGQHPCRCDAPNCKGYLFS